jgi:hypothetical protein
MVLRVNSSEAIVASTTGSFGLVIGLENTIKSLSASKARLTTGLGFIDNSKRRRVE